MGSAQLAHQEIDCDAPMVPALGVLVAEIRRARERVPTYDPRIRTAVAARLIGITPRRLRYQHRTLAMKISHRLSWLWSDIEQILAGASR
jgi:hypothetical protein